MHGSALQFYMQRSLPSQPRWGCGQLTQSRVTIIVDVCSLRFNRSVALKAARNANHMSTSQLETERLLDAALQMSRAELERFVARLFALKARQEAPSLTPGESELLMKINQGLPVEVQQRYDSLIRKRRRHKLTRAEHRELLALTQQIERHDVERLKRLSDLARLRGLSLPDLMQALGIEPPEPDYA